MHAIRIHETGGPDVLRYEPVARPEPEPTEALVRLDAVGVNFIDVYHRTGLYPLPLPTTPGQEGAGRVEAVGSAVRDVRVGDRVAYTGLLGAYALLLVQIAKPLGAFVIGTVSTPEKERLAREAGADEVIRYTEQDFTAETRRITGGAGVEVVYDSVGRTTFEGSLRALAPRGLLVLFGASSGPVPPVDPQRLSLGGSLFLTRPTLGHYTATRDELVARSDELLGWVATGAVRLRAEHEFPLAEAAAAHRELEGRRTTGKVLLIP